MSWIGIGTTNPGDVATDGKMGIGIGLTTPSANLDVKGKTIEEGGDVI